MVKHLATSKLSIGHSSYADYKISIGTCIYLIKFAALKHWTTSLFHQSKQDPKGNLESPHTMSIKACDIYRITFTPTIGL